MRNVAFRPVVTDEMKEAASRVLESGRYIRTDPDSDGEGKRFEAEFADFLTGPDNRRPAVANLSSGTAAMHLAWVVHGLGAGDEVIIPANTFSSVADCIYLVGADPVAVDVDEDTYNLDADAVSAAITMRTRAIMPVHTAGHPADMDRMMALAKKHDLMVIEDGCLG
ncbi:MAG: aminotransferase class I/II-fold pyridoxal phosphate-dependent enzyme, partial [Trueperaceae bacterium]